MTIDRQSENRTVPNILIALLIALTAYSIVVRIQLYSLGVTLWYDEALLVKNIVSQNLGELLTNQLNTGWGSQTAPLLYVAAVKLFTMAFGINETSVRILSFILCIAMLVCVYFIMSKVFRQSALFSWLAVCLTATLPLYVRYSNEMKPYMGDACFVVLILFLYYLYRIGRLKLFAYALCCALIVFFSTPSVFFIAAVFIVEAVRNIKNKEYKIAVLVVIAGVVAAAAFAFHYFYWLSSTATDPYMINSWFHNRFKLPTSRAAIEVDLYLLQEFLTPLGGLRYMFVAFGLAGYFISIARRNIYSVIVGFAFVMLLAASTIGMYPVISRLWLFTYVLCIIYTVYFLAHIRLKLENANIEKICSAVAVIGLSGFLLAGNASFTAYATGEATDKDYRGMNVNPLIYFVRDNIKEGEALYSFETATPLLWFKNGFENMRIGDVSEDNIFYGTWGFDAPFDDVDAIVARDNIYVLYNRGYIQYSQDFRVIGLSERLSKRGYMDRVLDINYTPLFWFTTDIANIKTDARIGLAGETDTGGLMILVSNTGKTILETADSALERGAIGYVKLVAKMYQNGELIEERVLSELPAPLLPGEQVEVEVDTGGTGMADTLVITLVSDGRFDFSDLGMTPIELPVIR